MRGPLREVGQSVGRHFPGSRPDAIADHPQVNAPDAKVQDTTPIASTTATTPSGAWTVVQKGGNGKYVQPAESFLQLSRDTFGVLTEKREFLDCSPVFQHSTQETQTSSNAKLQERATAAPWLESAS